MFYRVNDAWKNPSKYMTNLETKVSQIEPGTSAEEVMSRLGMPDGIDIQESGQYYDYNEKGFIQFSFARIAFDKEMKVIQAEYFPD